MKVLGGCLKETLFSWPNDCEGKGKTRTPLRVIGSSNLIRDEVTYISGKLIGH